MSQSLAINLLPALRLGEDRRDAKGLESEARSRGFESPEAYVRHLREKYNLGYECDALAKATDPNQKGLGGQG